MSLGLNHSRKTFKEIVASQEFLPDYLPGNLSLGGETRRARRVLEYCSSRMRVVVIVRIFTKVLYDMDGYRKWEMLRKGTAKLMMSHRGMEFG